MDTSSTAASESGTAAADPGGGSRIARDLIASDRVEGTKVRRPSGDAIGQIDRVMIEKRSGRVAYAVMSFGGFLGIGSDHYPIPWGRLKYNERLDAYELDISDEELRGAPHYANEDTFDWGDRSRGREIYDYYGMAPFWGL